VLFDDFEDFSFGDNNNNNNQDENQDKNNQTPSSSDLYASLRARQEDLKTSLEETPGEFFGSSKEEEEYFLENWRTAQCSSTVRLTLNDWIRRIAVDTYPLAVCGTAGGHLYLADLQEGEELDCLLNVHVSRNEDLPERPSTQLLEALDTLYGQFDGGGVMALALKDDWIVSAGREGGAHLCRIVGIEEKVFKGSRGGTSTQTSLSLQRMGRFAALGRKEDGKPGPIITSISFDATGTLWMAGYDGLLRAFDYEERSSFDKPDMLRQLEPLMQIDLGAPIVNLAINDELGCGVASTTEGAVIFSLEDGEIYGKWNPLVKKVRKEFVRSAILLKDDSNPNSEESPVWSLVCGGSKGSLFQRKLNVDRTGCLSESQPFLDQVVEDESTFPIKMRPNHMGAVVALSSPAPGLLVSGALDGSMRVWDYSEFGEDDDDEEDIDEEEEDDAESDQELEAQYDDVQPNDTRPQCLYALSGYKVWLGSIFSSSRKLVSDGADNTIVHSFENEEEVLFSEDDDEDDLEGFSFE